MAKEPKTPKAKKERPPKAERKIKDSTPKKSNFFLASLASKPWFKIVEIVFATLLLVMLVFYGAAMLFADKSGFTIAVGDTKKDKAAISLSESADFSSPTVRLDAGGIREMTNISALELPADIDTKDGAHGGDNYIAYTFYVKNTGDVATSMRSDMNMTSVLKNADEAIRVRVYKNGQETTYAKAAKNGEAEFGTIPFAEDRVVFSVTEEDFQPNEIIKYTFVIWLEGDDPECLDDIRGGNVKMSLTFSVVDEETS